MTGSIDAYGPDDRFRVTVVRTFDAKTIYHHPELAISYPEASLGSGRSATDA